MNDEQSRHARSFGGVAHAYHRGRPTYGADAARWLVEGEADTGPLTVLELGAGTGKLTEALVALGHDVHATEPDEDMLAILRRAMPGVRTSATGAEELPVTDQSVDVVVAAQCYHWFDTEVALPEIARVLRPGGHLAVAWYQRDERIPWVRKLGRIIGTQEQLRDPTATVTASTYFDEVAAETFKHWQTVDRTSIQDLALSRSNVAVMDDDERDRTIADLLALYDDYGRGMDGMQLLYLTACYRSAVVGRPARTPAAEPEATVPISLSGSLSGSLSVPGERTDPPADPLTDSASTIPRVAAESTGSTDDDTAMLLIDFR